MAERDRERDRAIRHNIGRGGVCIRLAKTGMCENHCVEDHMRRWRGAQATIYKRDPCIYGDRCRYVLEKCIILCPYYHTGTIYHLSGFHEVMQTIILNAHQRAMESTELTRIVTNTTAKLDELATAYMELQQKNHDIMLENARLRQEQLRRTDSQHDSSDAH